MKKVLNIVLTLVILFSYTIKNVNALSVTKNDIVIDSGKTEKIELYTNSDVEIIKVNFTLVYSTYDIPANFIINNSFTDETPNSITHSIVFDKAKKGKITLGTIEIAPVEKPKELSGSINIHTTTAITTDGKTINLKNQTINVTVKDNNQEPEDKNLLKSIDSTNAKIELKKDVFEYEVVVNEDIKELDLKPIGINDNVKIDVSSQKIADLKDNKILITTKLNNIEQVYTINVKVKKIKNIAEEIVIDNSKFVADNSYKSKWIIIMVGLVVASIVVISINKYKTKSKHRKKR